MNDLVGFCGAKRSGKDTASKQLTQSFGYTRIALADPLKAACREIFGFNDAQLHGDLKEVPDSYWGLSPRSAMQVFGDECMRQAFGKKAVADGSWTPDQASRFWIRVAERRIEQDGGSCAVPDVRYLNEATWLLNRGGMLLHIIRPGVRDQGDLHASEAGLPIEELKSEYPGQVWEFLNEGTEANLQGKVLWAVIGRR